MNLNHRSKSKGLPPNVVGEKASLGLLIAALKPYESYEETAKEIASMKVARHAKSFRKNSRPEDRLAMEVKEAS